MDDGRPASPEQATSRKNRWLIAAALLGLLLVVLFALSLTRGGPGEDRLDESSTAGKTAEAAAADDRCGSQQTYDRVKRELFRRAAQVRGSDQAAFDRLSAYAAVRVEAPVLKREDEELGTQVCSGRISIDLPPGVAVVGGRRSLTADADYALQPAADGSGDVVTLSGADPIIVPLATLARTGTNPQLPAAGAAAGEDPGQASPTVPVEPSQPAMPEEAPPVAVVRALPSFNCANARTRGEVAVCANPELAELDRFMASKYISAIRSGDDEERALLERTRGRFLGYRDNCRNDACIAAAYRGRMREIDDIMAGRWIAPR